MLNRNEETEPEAVETMTMPEALAILRHVAKCVKEGWAIPFDGILLEQVTDFLAAYDRQQKSA